MLYVKVFEVADVRPLTRLASYEQWQKEQTTNLATATEDVEEKSSLNPEVWAFAEQNLLQTPIQLVQLALNMSTARNNAGKATERGCTLSASGFSTLMHCSS